MDLFDKEQFENLRIWCDYCVKDRTRPCLCPSFVWLIDDSTEFFLKHRVLKLCQIEKILKGRGSASITEFENSGITRSSFKELLAKCWAGAPFKRKPSLQQLLVYSEATKKLIVGFTVARID